MKRATPLQTFSQGVLTRATRYAELATTGRPTHFTSAWAWALFGIRRQWLAAVVSLALAWSGLRPLMSAAVAFIVISSLLSLVAALVIGGPTAFGFILIAVSSTALASVAVIVGSLDGLPASLVGLSTGAVMSITAFALTVACEPLTLQLHGHRRLSRRERERVEHLLHEAARRMGLATAPPILISDDGNRNAATYLRHIVVSRTLCNELDDDQLSGLLAHELHHWACADTVGQQFVFTCALPLALLYNLSTRLSRVGSLPSVVGGFFLWPAWMLTRVVIRPLIAREGRRHEYEADAAAKAAGYGDGLSRALAYLGDFEAGRSGWEQVVAASHPPTELRLEALESPVVLVGGQK